MNRMRVIDWLSRKRVWPYYREYTDTQWYSRAELDQFTWPVSYTHLTLPTICSV